MPTRSLRSRAVQSLRAETGLATWGEREIADRMVELQTNQTLPERWPATLCLDVNAANVATIKAALRKLLAKLDAHELEMWKPFCVEHVNDDDLLEASNVKEPFAVMYGELRPYKSRIQAAFENRRRGRSPQPADWKPEEPVARKGAQLDLSQVMEPMRWLTEERVPGDILDSYNSNTLAMCHEDGIERTHVLSFQIVWPAGVPEDAPGVKAKFRIVGSIHRKSDRRKYRDMELHDLQMLQPELAHLATAIGQDIDTPAVAEFWANIEKLRLLGF